MAWKPNHWPVLWRRCGVHEIVLRRTVGRYTTRNQCWLRVPGPADGAQGDSQMEKKGAGQLAPLPLSFQFWANSPAKDHNALLSRWPSVRPPTGRVVLRRMPMPAV